MKAMKKFRYHDLAGSMTVEISFLMPMILLLIMTSILSVFYFHDKNVLAAAAYETAVAGSVKVREPGGVDAGELHALYAERVRGKCILFSASEAQIEVGEEQIEVYAQAARGRFELSVLKKASVTEPEKYIRDKRRVKEIIHGASNYN